MPHAAIPPLTLTTLKEFYGLMDRTRHVKADIVEKLFQGQGPQDFELISLQNALASLEDISKDTDAQELFRLKLDAENSLSLDLTYEIGELKKDLFFLEHGEHAFLDHLSQLHKDFDTYVDAGVQKLFGKKFNCFITDRDGTTNNYCGRYRSSVQSVYNAVFLSRFAQSAVDNPIFITSAPLLDGGIADISVNPPKQFIYAASKGREFIDLKGTRKTFPIDEEKQHLLDGLNKRLLKLVSHSAYEQFSLIGSGLQFKFGQTTIARQDINNSVAPDDSLAFLNFVEDMVREVDPEQTHFRIEDTGLDIEIILTIEADGATKDFDKADGVDFLNNTLALGMNKGPHLVCGDTGSDVPMVEAALRHCPDTHSIFVTKKQELKERVLALCPNAIIVPEPDMLVTIVYKLA